MEINIRKVSSKENLELVFMIRKEVFVLEQNCPPELEWEHEAESIHFIAEADSEPLGTARWRRTDGGFKLERFAVLKKYRGLGVGKKLVLAVLADLPEESESIYLHAQVPAYAFYEKLGFVKQGSQFEEAGIKHYKMVKI